MLTGREVVVARQARVREPLVVPKVEIGLGTIVRHENLTVLVGAHRSRINVEIGIKLLQCHSETPALQQPPNRRRGQPFAQRGNHSARYKDELGCHAALLNECVYSFKIFRCVHCQ